MSNYRQIIIVRVSSAVLCILAFSGAQLLAQDSSIISQPPDTVVLHAPPGNDRLFFHHPPRVILNNRPLIIDMFLELDAGNIAKVSIFVKRDNDIYREMIMPGKYRHYQLTLPVSELQGDTLTYFFMASMKDEGIYGYPLDAQGKLKPFTIEMAEPTPELFRRLQGGR